MYAVDYQTLKQQVWEIIPPQIRETAGFVSLTFSEVNYSRELGVQDLIRRAKQKYEAMNFEGSIEIAEMAAEFAVTNIEHGRIARLTGQSLITLNRLSEALQVLEQGLEIFDVYDFRARELYFLWGAIAVVRRLEKAYTWLVAAKDTDTLHADFAQALYNRLMEGAELLVGVAMNGIELSYDSSSQEIILTAKNSAAAAIATPFLHLLQQKSPGGAKITLKVRGKS